MIGDLRNSDEKNINFTFQLIQENRDFFQRVIYTNLVKGNLKYSLTSAFYEGLEILEMNNSEIPQETTLEIRYYIGNTSKKENEICTITSIVTKPSIKNWIENFIYFRRKKNWYYNKRDLIDELVEMLTEKYKSSLLKLPR